MEGESIKHTHTKSRAECLLISNTAEIKYQIPGLFLPLFSLLFSPHTLGHPQATLSVWRHWKAVSTLKRERKKKKGWGGYFSLVLPVWKKTAMKWKRPLAKRADKRVCPSFSPPLKWPVLRAKRSVGLAGGASALLRTKHLPGRVPCLMATPATMKRAVREPHKAWGGFPCSQRLSLRSSGAEGVPHGKAQGLKRAMAATSQIGQAMVTALSCSWECFTGRYACWGSEPLAPTPHGTKAYKASPLPWRWRPRPCFQVSPAGTAPLLLKAGVVQSQASPSPPLPCTHSGC